MKLLLSFAVAALMFAPASAGTPCRDAKGKFMKCPPVAVVSDVTVDKNGKCHVASGPKKGQFTACPKK